MRRAAAVDRNQPEIVAAFRRLGCSVAHTHTLGKGHPDLVVGFRGQSHIVEVKDGSKPPSKRRLTPDEESWRNEWRGDYSIVESVDDVIALVRSWST